MRLAAEDPAASGLQDRIESLFVAHVEAVYNVAYRVLWNRADAEDVTQRTFVKAITRGDQLRHATRARPWLLQIAYREAITVLRQRRDVPTDPSELPETPVIDGSPADAAVAADVRSIVGAALARLSPDERMAVVLRDVEGLPMNDVAEVLGVGVSAAKMRVHRGRLSLRACLATKEVC
jgi:RNA polymerase sigma-70 factor, ECF subfamily